MSKDMNELNEAQLEWIKFRQDTLGEDAFRDPQQSNFGKKLRSNPFVPFGAALTCGALGYGLYCFKKGNQRKSQIMMRARIAAQGFTIIAILGGIVLGATPNQPLVKPKDS